MKGCRINPWSGNPTSLKAKNPKHKKKTPNSSPIREPRYEMIKPQNKMKNYRAEETNCETEHHQKLTIQNQEKKIEETWLKVKLKTQKQDLEVNAVLREKKKSFKANRGVNGRLGYKGSFWVMEMFCIKNGAGVLCFVSTCQNSLLQTDTDFVCKLYLSKIDF